MVNFFFTSEKEQRLGALLCLQSEMSNSTSRLNRFHQDQKQQQRIGSDISDLNRTSRVLSVELVVVDMVKHRDACMDVWLLLAESKSAVAMELLLMNPDRTLEDGMEWKLPFPTILP